MKCDIILAGVGGQGILSIATVIGYAAVEKKIFLKQAEVHGMSQRGGAVQSHLRLSDREIHSDLVARGSADLIISVEPMETLRYFPYLNSTSWIVSNTTPFKNIPNYPDIQDVLAAIRAHANHITLDAESIARNLGNLRGMNMVVTGAASPFIDLAAEAMEEGIRKIFTAKGEEVVQKNLDAFRAGRDFALENRKPAQPSGKV